MIVSTRTFSPSSILLCSHSPFTALHSKNISNGGAALAKSKDECPGKQGVPDRKGFAGPETARSAPPYLVRAKRPRPPLAPHARPLRHLGLRNHAPADPGQNRDPLLGTLAARTPRHPRA